jgi:SET domain-containing protein
MGGIFTLAAMINHSCDPCAEIRGYEYVDCNIDVVAKRSIKKGEEITISYLGVQPSSTSAILRNRRQRELESRYLFICTCSCCKEQCKT